MILFVKTLKYSALTILLLLLLFILINQIDVPLNPDLKAIIQKQQDFPHPSENAYVASAGFYASPGEDMYAMGEKVLKAYEISTDKPNFSTELVQDAATVELDESEFNVCYMYGFNVSSCLTDYKRYKDDYRNLIDKNRLLIERYHKLISYPHFFETSVHLPMNFISIHKVFLADLGLKWIDDNKREALRLLIADISFNRMMLKESRYIIDQLFAIGRLKWDYVMLAKFVKECLQCFAGYAGTDEALKNLDDQELSMRHVIEGELWFNYKTMQEREDSKLSKIDQYLNDFYRFETYEVYLGIPVEERNKLIGLLGYLSLANVSMNRQFEEYQRYIDLSKYKFAEFFKMKTEIIPAGRDSDLSWYEYLYNPGGKIREYDKYRLFPTLDHYMEEPFKLDALIRLTRILFYIKQHEVNNAEVPNFLADLDSEDMNPYTEEAVKFDPANLSIFINAHNSSTIESSKIEVRLY